MLNTLVVVQELTKFNVEIQRDIITQVQGGSMSECHLTSTLKIKRFVFFFFCMGIMIEFSWISWKMIWD